jgi:hypothetical protein
VRCPVLGVHPRPGIVADSQLAQRDGEPRGLLGADPPAVAVAADGVAHRYLPDGGGKPGRGYFHARGVQSAGAAGDVRVCPRGRAAHGRADLAVRRGERRDEIISAGENWAAAGRGTGGRMVGYLERRALRRATGGVGAQVGPVTLAIHAKQFGERDPGFRRVLAQRGGDERDGCLIAVPDGDRGGDALRGQQADRMAGNGAGGPRVRQVISERDPDLGGSRLGADHHDAAPGGEPEQARDDREQGRR